MDAALSLDGQQHSGNLRPRGPGGRSCNARHADGVWRVMDNVGPLVGPWAPVGAGSSNDSRPCIDVAAH
eukprot:4347688-Alexandrium_andersonii.AAC.1